ncbi:YkvA family protein [Streptococcus fryi]
MFKKMSEKESLKALKKEFNKSEGLLNNRDELETLLQRVEEKLSLIPTIGKKLAIIPTLISLIRNYVKGEYTDIPIGSIISIISALIYFLSPIDFVPDFIPGAGLLDDTVVLMTCLKMVESDVYEYRQWRKRLNKDIK